MDGSGKPRAKSSVSPLPTKAILLRATISIPADLQALNQAATVVRLSFRTHLQKPNLLVQFLFRRRPCDSDQSAHNVANRPLPGHVDNDSMRAPLCGQAEKVIVVRHEHPTVPPGMSKVLLLVLGSLPIHFGEHTDLYAPLPEPFRHD